MVQVQDFKVLHSDIPARLWEHDGLPSKLSFNKIHQKKKNPENIPHNWQMFLLLTTPHSLPSFTHCPHTWCYYFSKQLSLSSPQGMNSEPEKGLGLERSGIGHCHLVKSGEKFPETWITCGVHSQGEVFPVSPELASTLQHLYVPGRHRQVGRSGDWG